ncbi:hypothetical protein F7725_005147 [Dissostichus mawsoni]|uniref:Uncharacterized protein n=1 Tax=Dissostichus mawsoni TaxID=36200 RepID=A0A7J5YQE6_DISMA|nr:hypothetical protein F7725_005147 [Dissostichus mawsoni]
MTTVRSRFLSVGRVRLLLDLLLPGQHRAAAYVFITDTGRKEEIERDPLQAALFHHRKSELWQQVTNRADGTAAETNQPKQTSAARLHAVDHAVFRVNENALITVSLMSARPRSSQPRSHSPALTVPAPGTLHRLPALLSLKTGARFLLPALRSLKFHVAFKRNRQHVAACVEMQMFGGSYLQVCCQSGARAERPAH